MGFRRVYPSPVSVKRGRAHPSPPPPAPSPRAHICVGHCPGLGLDPPLAGTVLQVTEVGGSSAFSSKGMEAILQMMCPHPVRFRKVCPWSPCLPRNTRN